MHLLSSGVGRISNGPFTPLALQLNVCRANGLWPDSYSILVMSLSFEKTAALHTLTDPVYLLSNEMGFFINV